MSTRIASRAKAKPANAEMPCPAVRLLPFPLDNGTLRWRRTRWSLETGEGKTGHGCAGFPGPWSQFRAAAGCEPWPETVQSFHGRKWRTLLRSHGPSSHNVITQLRTPVTTQPKFLFTLNQDTTNSPVRMHHAVLFRNRRRHPERPPRPRPVRSNRWSQTCHG